MIAPFARRRATTVASNGGTSMAKFTSLFAVVRMSFVSYGSLTAVTTQYIGSDARSGAGAVLRVELGGALQGIGLPAERLAHGRRTRRERSGRRVRIERALARDRSFAADVERFERIQLPRIRDPHPHAHLGGDARIGHRPLHAAVIKRQAPVLIQVGQDRGSLHGPRREHQRRAGSHVSGRGGDIGAVRGEQRRADTVIGLRAIDVGLHHAPARGLARRDGRVDARDGGFLHREWRPRLGHHAHGADAPPADDRAHDRERDAKRQTMLHGP